MKALPKKRKPNFYDVRNDQYCAVQPVFPDVLTAVLNDKIKKETNILSPREREVMRWLKQGKCTWDIAELLNIRERTVKFHVGNIKQKLDATTRAHAVAIAIQKGLIDIM